MIQWLERVPLPQVCETCEDADCDVCEHALERWYLPPRRRIGIKGKNVRQKHCESTTKAQ